MIGNAIAAALRPLDVLAVEADEGGVGVGVEEGVAEAINVAFARLCPAAEQRDTKKILSCGSSTI